MPHDFAALLFSCHVPVNIVTLIVWRGSRYGNDVSRRWHGSDHLLDFYDRWSIGLSGYALKQSDLISKQSWLTCSFRSIRQSHNHRHTERWERQLSCKQCHNHNISRHWPLCHARSWWFDDYRSYKPAFSLKNFRKHHGHSTDSRHILHRSRAFKQHLASFHIQNRTTDHACQLGNSDARSRKMLVEHRDMAQFEYQLVE